MNQLRMILCERLLGLILWIVPKTDKDGHRLMLWIERYFIDALTETLTPLEIPVTEPWTIMGNTFYHGNGTLMTPEETDALRSRMGLERRRYEHTKNS